jgi:hypothetical protein
VKEPDMTVAFPAAASPTATPTATATPPAAPPANASEIISRGTRPIVLGATTPLADITYTWPKPPGWFKHTPTQDTQVFAIPASDGVLFHGTGTAWDQAVTAAKSVLAGAPAGRSVGVLRDQDGAYFVAELGDANGKPVDLVGTQLPTRPSGAEINRDTVSLKGVFDATYDWENPADSDALPPVSML